MHNASAKNESQTPLQVSLDLTSSCVKTARLHLPYIAENAFSEVTKLTVQSPEKDKLYELTFEPPRKLSGLEAFFEDMDARANDKFILQLEGAEGNIWLVKRPTPKRRKVSDESAPNEVRPKSQVQVDNYTGYEPRSTYSGNTSPSSEAVETEEVLDELPSIRVIHRKKQVLMPQPQVYSAGPWTAEDVPEEADAPAAEKSAVRGEAEFRSETPSEATSVPVHKVDEESVSSGQRANLKAPATHTGIPSVPETFVSSGPSQTPAAPQVTPTTIDAALLNQIVVHLNKPTTPAILRVDDFAGAMGLNAVTAQAALEQLSRQDSTFIRPIREGVYQIIRRAPVY